MHELDQKKTTFITHQGIFYSKVMLLELKNAGATYQRMITMMFGHLIESTMDANIDDMEVKNKEKQDHLKDLVEVFKILKDHKLRLNAAKCDFGVSPSKFLGHLVTQ